MRRRTTLVIVLAVIFVLAFFMAVPVVGDIAPGGVDLSARKVNAPFLRYTLRSPSTAIC